MVKNEHTAWRMIIPFQWKFWRALKSFLHQEVMMVCSCSSDKNYL